MLSKSYRIQQGPAANKPDRKWDKIPLLSGMDNGYRAVAKVSG